MRRLACGVFAVLLAVLLAGCAPRAQGTRQAVTLGEHHVSLHVPDGWQLVEFGRTLRVSKDGVVLTLGDLGPAGPEGIQREVDRAQALWRKGQPRDARAVLARVPVPDELFGTQVERTAFRASWSEVSSAPDDADPNAIDEAFERIRANVAALARPELRVLAGTVLAKVEPSARRDVAAMHPRLVSGREAVVYRTWDRLTHGNPRRVALVFDGGYALELEVEAGSIDRAAPAFETLLDSLRFVPAGEAGASAAGAPAVSGANAPR